ncbi:uncharacterized protein ASCRUDRAFT_7582 [Ascoidea rubescens DSM 1968]|uniref:Uncharacterized protein n=1 Tax=Ascoidea rubescens DSM 1968 TaxID=1344418 RepID=A0A1D2VI95_9ASCO|nr:hypothetical protein ASCRUDRAFT_7582 [Ascoidea rubescens DSM 1968]ODV61335.1 hypothetical protein ASCRUDRAFT_7582 [Ascoidea rubescens DSM 1968]
MSLVESNSFNLYSQSNHSSNSLLSFEEDSSFINPNYLNDISTQIINNSNFVNQNPFKDNPMSLLNYLDSIKNQKNNLKSLIDQKYSFLENYFVKNFFSHNINQSQKKLFVELNSNIGYNTIFFIFLFLKFNNSSLFNNFYFITIEPNDYYFKLSQSLINLVYPLQDLPKNFIFLNHSSIYDSLSYLLNTLKFSNINLLYLNNEYSNLDLINFESNCYNNDNNIFAPNFPDNDLNPITNTNSISNSSLSLNSFKIVESLGLINKNSVIISDNIFNFQLSDYINYMDLIPSNKFQLNNYLLSNLNNNLSNSNNKKLIRKFNKKKWIYLGKWNLQYSNQMVKFVNNNINLNYDYQNNIQVDGLLLSVCSNALI